MTSSFALQNASEADDKQPIQPIQPIQSLGRSYRGCAARSRRKNAARRANALRALGFHDNSRLTFSAATRARVSPQIIARIRSAAHTDEGSCWAALAEGNVKQCEAIC